MRSVKSKRTKFEKDFYDALISVGVNGIEWTPSGIFGKPDFANKNAKVAVFLDSCFWHGCSKHFRLPNSNVEYWQDKIKKNKKRDKYVTNILSREGWTVVRIWEHSLVRATNLKKWARKVSNLILEKTSLCL